MRAYSNQGHLTSTLEQLRQRASDQRKRRPLPKGSKRHALRRRLSAEQKAAIVAKYEAGESANQLMSEFGLGKGSVLAILRDGGASIRQRRCLTDAEVDEIVALYEGGQSLACIGDRFGVVADTVGAALERRGIARRDTQGRPR